MRKLLRRRKAAVLAVVVLALLGLRLAPKPAILDGVPFSQAVYDKDRRLLRLTLAADEQYRLRLPLARVSLLVVEATLLQEDRWFYWHPGLNPWSLARAAWRTYGVGDRRVGGSTLTMQLARVRYGLDTRTVPGKLAQMARAVQLEVCYSKNEILEAYLNLVAYGGNVHGVGAASLIYFGRDPHKLTLPEALTLAVIPQHPVRRRPGADGSAEGRGLPAARAMLYARFTAFHPEAGAEKSALALPFAARSPRELPFLAPHFAESALRANPGRAELNTTLDLALQRLLERGLRAYVERKKPLGIRNAAALLVDYRDMSVRAAVGSADWFNNDIQGQVNGTQAKRSPGSAMKPFLYALGMEQGRIHPLSMLKDAPTSFGGYNPENFDHEFVGPIKARDALIHSRNLPAVQVAAQLAQPSLYEFFQRAGITQLREERFYGLALALGGAEMTIEEVVRLYAMLANGGVLKPLRTRVDEPESEGERLLTREAAFLTLDILKDNPRPAQGFRAEWTRDAIPVHWKTGTSFAFRDAWSVGVFGPYVLAVWIGHFNGDSNPAFVGVEAAAPLMFEIVDAVRAHARGLPAARIEPPASLARVKVCVVSGHIPGPHCHHAVETWFIPGTSPIKTCEVHRAVLVDAHTKRRACQAGADTRLEVYEFWPSDLLKLFRRAGIPRRTPPPDNPDCPLEVKAARGVAPRITSPQPNLTYSLRAASVGRDTIPLQAVTDADARRVYWFVDGRYLGESTSGQPYFWVARPGQYVVRAVDDQGRADARDLKVAVVE